MASSSSSSTASSRLLVAALLLLALQAVLASEESEPIVRQSPAGRGLLDAGGGGIDCGGACAERCKLSSRPNLCKRACGTCCARCSCVPPGTYGNYDACPCYAQMTTRGGKRKCP